MSMDAGTLSSAISEVCPCDGTQVGSSTDRATWSFTPGAGATQPQIDDGNNVIQTIPMDQEPPPSPAEVALYDHENRILELEGQPPITMSAFRAKMIKARK